MPVTSLNESLRDRKEALRRQAHANRQALPNKDELSEDICRKFAELPEYAAAETVMFRDGRLTEASSSNVLLVIDGTIVAPPKDNLILPGITYDAALEFAGDAGLRLEVRPVPREETLDADEMWLSSSTKEVLAVTTVDGRSFGGGVPGPVFRQMYEIFQARKASGR